MRGSPVWAAPFDAGDEPTPCWADQIAVSASPTQAAVGHRALTLVFSLAGGAVACTLSGYPGVDSGAGGPPIHAVPTLRGYMGGLPDGVDVPPTVTLSITATGAGHRGGHGGRRQRQPVPDLQRATGQPSRHRL